MNNENNNVVPTPQENNGINISPMPNVDNSQTVQPVPNVFTNQPAQPVNDIPVQTVNNVESVQPVENVVPVQPANEVVSQPTVSESIEQINIGESVNPVPPVQESQVNNVQPIVEQQPIGSQQVLNSEEVKVVDSKPEEPKNDTISQTVQSFYNEPKKKKSKAVPFLVFIIILLCLGIVAMYLYYNGYLDKYMGKSSSNNAVENTKTDDETIPTTLVSKLNVDKEWIYDAEYEKNVDSKSYLIGEKTYYAKDIIVPYININSTFAKKSNTEIKNIFDDAIAKYNKGVDDKITYVDECNYKKYVNDDLVSVILTYGIGATDVVHPLYYTYNINLKDGNEISFEDAYKNAGYNFDNITSKVENSIKKSMENKLKNMDKSNYPEGTNFDTFLNKSINNYKESVSKKTIKYFLSDDNKLNIIVNLNLPVGTGEFDTIITVE